ncbi:MAG TPA: hypothetical protein VL443_28305 [Cyclobacteriaceae bacterium]|jgi:hypothetical protein|nr:hypothetical protein [Cyclobacteriaceae bacterium]
MLKLVQNMLYASESGNEQEIRSSKLLRTIDLSIAIVSIVLVVMAVKMFF